MPDHDPRYANRWHNHDDRYETQSSIEGWHKTYRPSGGTGGTSEGFGKNSDPGALGGTAVGNAADATGSNAVAVGQLAIATGDFSVAVGQASAATGDRAIALGQNTTSATDDTAVIKANDLVLEQSNGTGATRIRMTDANNVDYWLEVDTAGALTVTPV